MNTEIAHIWMEPHVPEVDHHVFLDVNTFVSRFVAGEVATFVAEPLRDHLKNDSAPLDFPSTLMWPYVGYVFSLRKP